jgi:hypothetical protein
LVVNFSGLLLAEKLIYSDCLKVGGLGDSYDFDLPHPYDLKHGVVSRLSHAWSSLCSYGLFSLIFFTID